MSDPVREPEDPRSAPIRSLAVLHDGLLAGLIGGLVVILVVGVYDAIVGGEPLRTPSVLNALLFQGAEAALSVEPELTLAVAYNAVHLLLWLVAGIAAAWLVTLVEHHPAAWYLVFVGVSFAFGAFLYLEGALGVPGLGRLQLFSGAVIGSAAMAAFLWWRHPGITEHLGDIYG